MSGVSCEHEINHNDFRISLDVYRPLMISEELNALKYVTIDGYYDGDIEKTLP